MLSDQFILSSRRFSPSIVNRFVCCYKMQRKRARGLVLFNKQTVKDFLWNNLKFGKWKPKRFGWKPPTAGKVGKYFDSFPIWFFFYFCLHVWCVCVWAKPIRKNWMDVKQSLNKSWRNLFIHLNVNFSRLKYDGRLFCLSRNGHQSWVTPTPHAKRIHNNKKKCHHLLRASYLWVWFSSIRYVSTPRLFF